jgi:hypothetical protein
MKIEGSGFASGSISQRHGSADPDPHQMSLIRNTGIFCSGGVAPLFCVRGGGQAHTQ